MKFTRTRYVSLTVSLLLFSLIGDVNAHDFDELDQESLTIDVNLKTGPENRDGISLLDGSIMLILNIATFTEKELVAQWIIDPEEFVQTDGSTYVNIYAGFPERVVTYIIKDGYSDIDLTNYLNSVKVKMILNSERFLVKMMLVVSSKYGVLLPACATKETAVKNSKVTLLGFGTFIKSRRKARNGENPQTGEPIKINLTTTVKFSDSEEPEETNQ